MKAQNWSVQFNNTIDLINEGGAADAEHDHPGGYL